MGLGLEYIDGQTPLNEDEKEGIMIPFISTRDEFDEFEQQNIEKAIEWTIKRKFKKEEILSELFTRELHRKMFGDVWKWAGEFRRTEKSIGIDPVRISISLKQLCDDCLYCVDSKGYSDEETAIRFKHSLVKIHCYANGNGRHSRLMADVIINNVFKKPVFTWGRTGLLSNGDVRKNYICTLREADSGNILPLLKFAKS